MLNERTIPIPSLRVVLLALVVGFLVVAAPTFAAVDAPAPSIQESEEAPGEPAEGAAGQEAAEATSDDSTASERLAALIEEVEKFQEEENPLPVPEGVDERYDDRMPAISEEHYRKQAAKAGEFLERLEAIDDRELSSSERIDADVLARQLRRQVEEVRFRTYLIPITNREGFHISFARMPDRKTLESVEDYDEYVAELQSFREYTARQIELMRQGLEIGMTLPRVVLEGYEETISAHLVDDPTDSRFHGPLESIPDTIPEVERQRIVADGTEAIRESVIPAYRDFLEFMVEEYIPGARESIAAAELPDGREFYEHRVRHYTTLELTPEEVHEIGLREVERLRAEMEAIIEEVGFEGSFEEFLEHLRTDPRFYVEEPLDYIRQAAWIAKRMDGQLPRLFDELPETPYGIEKIPDFIAPKTTGAYYSPGDPEEHRAGDYYLNLSKIDSRPLYVLEALTFHEAVPGHHLQIMLAKENEAISKFRRDDGVTAFVEGWALYSERLGKEVGFYTDPYSDFGRLTYEIWRACRLVVDTGMHAMGWSRERAIDYLAGNTALSIHEVTTEIDRYIAWPGQALAYKMGELKITELRRRAREALGGDFSLREFHDAVLRNGSIPLSSLEDEVDRWIESELEEEAEGESEKRDGESPGGAEDRGSASDRRLDDAVGARD